MAKTKTICTYDTWTVKQTDQTLILHNLETNTNETIKEVYRFRPGEYENVNIPDLEQKVNEIGISFDYCGELDDFSGYVFWKII